MGFLGAFFVSLAPVFAIVAAALPGAPACASVNELPPAVASGFRLVPTAAASCSVVAPVLTADVSGAPYLCLVPYSSRLITVNGQTFLSGPMLLTLSQTNHPAGSNYDVWAINNAGALAICAEGSLWSSTSARSSTPSTSASAGVAYANQVSLPHCYNGSTDYGSIATSAATYLGSFYVPTATATTTTGQTSGATTLAVAAALVGPGLFEQYYVLVYQEYELVTGGFGTTTLTVTRGQFGTSAAAHGSGAAVSVAGGQTAVQMAPAYNSAGGNSPLMGLSNAYNQLPINVQEGDGSSSYTYGTNTWRQAHGLATNEITVLDGLGLSPVTGSFIDNAQAGSSNADEAFLGVERNWSSGIPSGVPATAAGYTGGESTTVAAVNSWPPLVGLSTIVPLEISVAGTTTFYAARSQGQNWLLTVQLRY